MNPTKPEGTLRVADGFSGPKSCGECRRPLRPTHVAQTTLDARRWRKWSQAGSTLGQTTDLSLYWFPGSELPTNAGEASLILVALALGLPLPVLPLQLLWINLTDTLLGLPLAFEPKEEDVMKRPPRRPKQPLLTKPLLMRTGLVTLLMLSGALWLIDVCSMDEPSLSYRSH